MTCISLRRTFGLLASAGATVCRPKTANTMTSAASAAIERFIPPTSPCCSGSGSYHRQSGRGRRELVERVLHRIGDEPRLRHLVATREQPHVETLEVAPHRDVQTDPL